MGKLPSILTDQIWGRLLALKMSGEGAEIAIALHVVLFSLVKKSLTKFAKTWEFVPIQKPTKACDFGEETTGIIVTRMSKQQGHYSISQKQAVWGAHHLELS